jgi:hypothetical protein
VAKQKRTLLDDPRYPEFVERYYGDALRFAVEVCGMVPSEDQIDLLTEISLPGAKVSVVSGTGCFAAGTMMMRADGDAVAVEDVRTGDLLMGPDGASVRSVLELRRGRECMYRFNYMDGTAHEYNESHILTLAPGAKYVGYRPDIVDVTVRDWLQWPKTRRQRYYAYRSKVQSFEGGGGPLPVPPYILGLWLGDGTSSKPAITTSDAEIDSAFSAWCEALGCTISRTKNSENSWQVSAARLVGSAQENPATSRLRAVGVFENKHIPRNYLRANLSNREELLAGLIDTDGYCDGAGYQFSQKCGRMARDVLWLARSVGMRATIKPIRKRCGNNGVWGDYWIVTMSRGTSSVPFRLPRHQINAPRQRPHLLNGIRSVECLGEGDYFGFVLDGDHRFLADDFTVLHNTGKTATFGRIVLWHLLARPYAYYDEKVEIGSNTYVGAARLSQVADGVWKEANDADLAVASGDFAWIRDYYTINKTTIAVNGFESQWFVAQVAMQKGQSIGIAGKHRYHQLIIGDEAAGIEDGHFDVIEGTQTQFMNCTLLASQGVRASGYFCRTHHEISIDNGGSWVSLCFSSENSPFVTHKWLKAREQESGGRDSVEYRVRVLGQFAQSESEFLLTRDQVEAVFRDDAIIRDDEPYGLLVLSDVGMGEYRDDSVAVIAKVTGYGDFGDDARRVEYIEIPLCSNAKDEIDFTGDLQSVFGRISNGTLYVDAGGVGSAVCRLLERAGITVERVNWGKPCFKREYQDRYYNQRACAMVRFRDAVKQGRVRMPKGLSKKLREKIIWQASHLPYHFVEAGGLRYKMMRKEDMLAMGISSPDIIDAMSFAFLEDAHYIEMSADASSLGMAPADMRKLRSVCKRQGVAGLDAA